MYIPLRFVVPPKTLAERDGALSANTREYQSKFSYLWLVIGLGSQLQILYSLSISEIIILCVVPFVFHSELQFMRKNGIMPFFNITLFLLFGCIVSLIANHAATYQVIRGLAVTIILVCAVVMAHRMLRTDPNGLKWYFVGAMFSTFLCSFVFKHASDVAAMNNFGYASITSGALFWIERLKALFFTPSLAFYLKMPLAYSFGIPVMHALFSILTSASGRSNALGSLGAAAVVMIGKKNYRSIKAMGRHFLLVFCLAVLSIYVAKATYQWAALNNVLGEKARAKFEYQTAGGTGIVKLLIGGRVDAFVGLLAIAESPILGKGYWAPDTKGYYETFLAKYGNTMDYEEYMKRKLSYAEQGRIIRLGKIIACHSHITSFWLWYGLPGLIFWIYVVYVIFRYLRYDAYAIPQWFFWLAAGVPSFMWDLFFSPFTGRLNFSVWVVGMLLTRAVRQGSYQLPASMLAEIDKVEKEV